ncbi:MAG: flagellar motor switch protein FliN [Vulcanimicrobiaceae bacterium]
MSCDVPNLDRIRGVTVELSIEIGRRSLAVKDILALGTGAIVELDRRADAPVDLLVNGRVVARGEIVAVDECFGLRITELVSAQGLGR